MLAIVAPGQGAQKPGMLASWLELPGVRDRLTALGEAADLDLVYLGADADADEIKDTAITQPLVVATSLLAAELLPRESGDASVVTGGHSVGELAAAAIAGIMTAEQAVSLAAIRGRAMASACAMAPTSMAACMNPDIELILSALQKRELVGANVNGAGQVVAAGSQDAIDALVADAPEGVRVIALSVAGAFHTQYMAPAQAELAPKIAELSPADPHLPILTNSDGGVVSSGTDYLNLLLQQITSPVRWDRCMATLRELGVTGILELPPAGTLVGLAKRELKGIATFALKSADDLEAAAAFCAEHAGSEGQS